MTCALAGSAGLSDLVSLALYKPKLALPVISLWRTDWGLYQDLAGTIPAINHGDSVALWKEYYSPGNDLSQATPALRPTLDLLTIPGIPLLNLTGGQYLQRATLVGGTPATPYALFAAIQSTSGGTMFDCGSGAGRAILFWSGSGGKPCMVQRSSPAQAYAEFWAQPTPVFVAGVGWGDGAATDVWRNGGQAKANINAGTSAAAGFTVGANFNGTNPITGKCGDIALVSGDLAATQDKVRDFNNRWFSMRFGTPSYRQVQTGGSNRINAMEVCADGSIVMLYAHSDTNSQTTAANVMLRRSRDGGKSWTSPVTVVDAGGNIAVPTGLRKLANGTLIASYVKEQVTTQVGMGNFTIVSSDHGETWSAPRSVALPSGYQIAEFITYGGITEVTPGGTLFLPCHARLTGQQPDNALLLQSVDGGVNWTLRSVIMAGTVTPDKKYSEASIINTGGANWYAACRTIQGVSYSTSTDDGATWAAPTDFASGVVGTPGGISPNLKRLASGKVVLSLGCRSGSPNAWGLGSRMVYSTDNCTTWSTGWNVVNDPGGNLEGGYPWLVEPNPGNLCLAAHLGDGTLMTVTMKESALL